MQKLVLVFQITSPQSYLEEEEAVQRVGGFVMTKFIQTTVYLMQ